MNKSGKILILLLAVAFLFFQYFSRVKKGSWQDFISQDGSLWQSQQDSVKPQVALIFDDLGESLRDLRSIYALKIPVTLAIIPNLKFSKNIAYIGKRCDFTILIHLPLEPYDAEQYRTDKYTFISSSLPARKNRQLLKNYLNHVRIASGVNTHMGSKATEDKELMALVLKEIKKRNLIFIDSRTSEDSVAYALAQSMGVVSGCNNGFVDPFDDTEKIKEQLDLLIKEAEEKGKIIIIAHPKKNTLQALREKIPELAERISFITIEEYFGQ